MLECCVASYFLGWQFRNPEVWRGFGFQRLSISAFHFFASVQRRVERAERQQTDFTQHRQSALGALAK